MLWDSIIYIYIYIYIYLRCPIHIMWVHNNQHFVHYHKPFFVIKAIIILCNFTKKYRTLGYKTNITAGIETVVIEIIEFTGDTASSTTKLYFRSTALLMMDSYHYDNIVAI